MYYTFRDAFHRLFEAHERTFRSVLSRNIQNLERQLNKETLHEKDSNSDLCVIKVQFDKFIHSKVLEPSNYNSYDLETRQDFKEYTHMEAQTFKETIIQNMNSIEQCIIQEYKVQEVQASDASLGDKDCSRIVSDKGNDQGLENQSNTYGDESSRLRNECNDKRTSGDDMDIRPSYDTKPMVELLLLIKKQSNSIRDSYLVAHQKKQTVFESYKAFNDRTVDYDKLELVKEKHDKLVKQSLLTKSHYEGLVKEKTKVITDLKLKEEKDIDKMISIENQLMFLNEIVYKRIQSIETVHMLAPKCPTFNGRPTFANPIELVDQAWVKHSKDHFRAPTAQDMEILIKTCLMPLALKTQNDSFAFVHELKKEMHADLKYVESLKNEIDELESDKA
ncbi:hypothetical protein Tco_0750212 [Tanacetum coccineum]|uniref:Uncharacterized protein n=1 Tax=Tanacetum coccineum TaxID=301880 RepID=A0ABQ4Z387_9ASTR